MGEMFAGGGQTRRVFHKVDISKSLKGGLRCAVAMRSSRRCSRYQLAVKLQ